MSLTTTFRNAANAIKTAHPELSVAVVSGGVSATGLKATATDTAALADMGEAGASVGQARVNADAFVEPAKGATITVGGVACTVTACRTDGAGAFYVIEYAEQKPK